MYNTILGPLDGSKLGECTLDHIKAVATGCHVSNVVLLTVVEPVETVLTDGTDTVPHPITSYEVYSKEIKQMDKEKQQKAKDYLAKVASSLEKEGLAVQTVVISSEPIHGAAEKILEYAEKNKVELIVMSTHGRSGVSRWVMGSVTSKVANYSPIPVMIVAPAGCRVSK